MEEEEGLQVLRRLAVGEAEEHQHQRQNKEEEEMGPNSGVRTDGLLQRRAADVIR